MPSDSEHWDRVFLQTEDSSFGWYEASSSQTLALLDLIPGWEESTIFIAGAGASVLIEETFSRGANLVINDISVEALDRVKSGLPANERDIVWLCQDISKPIQQPLPEIDLWIDRAVLHFLTDEQDILRYFENVTSVLGFGSHVLFAQFALAGAPKCSGLTLHRYLVDELAARLGTSFTLVSQFDHIYINPAGDPRPYIYALFRREL